MSLFQRFAIYLNKNITAGKDYLCDFNRIKQELNPADILLIEGRSRISRYIKRITNSPWTHAALYIGSVESIKSDDIKQRIKQHYHGDESKPLVIESLAGSGTVISELDSYQTDHIRICRPNGILPQDITKVISFAANHLGYDYDVKHFIDLGRFYLRSILIPRRLLSRLFSKHPAKTDKEICSTLIGNAFKSIRFPILPLIQNHSKSEVTLIEHNARLLVPSDFDYSPYFDIIKYPILPDDNAQNYRNYPWKQGKQSDGEGNLIDIPKPNS